MLGGAALQGMPADTFIPQQWPPSPRNLGLALPSDPISGDALWRTEQNFATANLPNTSFSRTGAARDLRT